MDGLVPDMMRSEAERQFYLGMAGIRCWYARAPLSGAAPSPEFHFPDTEAEAGPEVAPEPAVVSRPERGFATPNTDKLARLQQMMSAEAPTRELVAPPKDTASEAVTEAPAATEDRPSRDVVDPKVEEAAPSIRRHRSPAFHAHWGVWQTPRSVLISALSEDSSSQLQQALADNILRAIGDREPVMQEVHWPVFRNPLVPGNGADGFIAVIQSLVAEFEGKTVILLGLLSGDEVKDRITWLEQTLGRYHVDFPHSLAALATAPALKRELWALLKPLTDVAR